MSLINDESSIFLIFELPSYLSSADIHSSNPVSPRASGDQPAQRKSPNRQSPLTVSRGIVTRRGPMLEEVGNGFGGCGLFFFIYEAGGALNIKCLLFSLIYRLLTLHERKISHSFKKKLFLEIKSFRAFFWVFFFHFWF